MGVHVGARARAARIGVSLEEYQRRVGAGEEFCLVCRNWMPASRIARDSCCYRCYQGKR